MKKQQVQDFNPQVTGSVGAIVGALIGTVIGVALAHQSVRETIKDQFDLYKDDSLDAIRDIHRKYTEKKSHEKDEKKLLTQAN